jgi:hypothetical protein
LILKTFLKVDDKGIIYAIDNAGAHHRNLVHNQYVKVFDDRNDIIAGIEAFIGVNRSERNSEKGLDRATIDVHCRNCSWSNDGVFFDVGSQKTDQGGFFCSRTAGLENRRTFLLNRLEDKQVLR